MRWLRRFLTAWATRIPSVQKLLLRANRAIEENELRKQASRIEDLMGQEIELQFSHLRQRMEDVLDLRRAELACVNPGAFESLRESHRGVTESVTQFKERLWELELALEDRGWVREVTLANLEFSRLGVQQLIRITRIYAIKNPLIKRGSEIVPMYVFGRGIEIRSEDETADAVIQDFLEANKKELGHIALAQKEQSIQTDGSLYFAFPAGPDGKVRVMMIDPLEIMDVITDPDDTSVPRYFKRQWTRIEAETNLSPEPKQVWYPAVDYVAKVKLDQIQGQPVNWDMPILRVKIGCPANWRWGIPPLYASIDWSRAYKDFLEDWSTVQRTLSRFALMIETKGGAGAIAAYNALLNTTFADNSGTQIERNPPPVTGSAHISGPGNKIAPFKSSGASESPEQSRRLLLMVAAAQGMPETFYGDASTGSLATAVSLDRPTELKFREIQQRWVDTLTQILRYVLSVSKGTPGGRMREAVKNADPVKIVVKFPAVLEHDVKTMVEAWGLVGSMGGRTGISAGVVDRRTIADGMLAEMGYENRGDLLDKTYGKAYDPSKDVSDQRTQVPPQLLKTASGKAMTDLSVGLPLPPPPAPIAAPGAVPAIPSAKERLKITEGQRLKRSKKLREAVEAGATEKAWIGGECDVCQENGDIGFIPEDEAFPSGDDEPPAHPNCGCDIETRDGEA